MAERMQNILVVDDDSENRQLTCQVLEEAGFHTCEARDGEDALVLLDFEKVDAIVSDIMMPLMDGYELCYHIRQDVRFSALPFVFCTSSVAPEEDGDFAATLGADAFVSRGMNSGELLVAVCEALGKPRAKTSPCIDPAREIEFLKEHGRRLVAKLEQRNAAVRESERRLSTLLNNINSVVWEAPSDMSRFTFVSKQAEGWLGYPIEQWLNEPGFWENHIHEEDRARVRQLSMEHVESSRRREMEYRMIASDGRVVWVRNVTSVLPLHREGTRLCGIMIDISRQKSAHESLRESEERYRTLVERNPDAILVHTEGMVAYANPAACRLMRVEHHSMLIGRLIMDLTHPSVKEKAEQRLKQLQRGETLAPVETKLVRLDGTVVEIESTSIPFRYEGETAVLSILRDHSDKTRLEEQLRQPQKMEAIGQLAGGVAHDFNNLLTVIQLHSSIMLTREKLDPSVHESAQQISLTADRASNLTRQLLTFSRKQVTRMVNLDMNDLVGNLTKMLHRILGEDVHLQVRFSPLPPLVHADAGMMEQVLMNLSVNARDAMPRGGNLVIQTEIVQLDAEAASCNPDARPGEFTCLSVTDTGTGMPEDVMQRIFEPFFTTKEVGKGTGLGLATVYGIVKQHQGWITVQSEEGAGTTFHVFLPRLDARAMKAAEPKGRPVLPRGKETILFVEDESGVRMVARCVLQQLGYKVIEAESGASALGIWKEHRDEVDLLLTDLVMPGGVNGRELAESLVGEKPGLRVVYTSGYSADVAGKELELIEGENFIRKPFRTESLAKTVRRVLDATQSEIRLPVNGGAGVAVA